MDKSMVKGMVIGGIVVAAASAVGISGYKTVSGEGAGSDKAVSKVGAGGDKAVSKPSYAEVLAVKDVTETVKKPREECQDVQVQKQAPVKDEHRLLGTVGGAVVGGALGSMVGSGRGKTVAAVAGAAGGGYAGNQVQKNMQEKDVVTTTEQRCKTVYDTTQKHLGYDVSYRLDGKQDVVRLAYNPGTRIPVKDGKLVLKAPEPRK